MRLTLLLLIAAAAGCGRPDAVANSTENTAALPDPMSQSAASPTGGPPANNAAAGATTTASARNIPAALRGRWGLTPADCTSAPGGAEGLLVVTPGQLQFYESRAVPSPGIQTSSNSVSGNFAFTGEGQEWTKYLTLEVRDGKLVRTERDPVASFRYVRC